MLPPLARHRDPMPAGEDQQEAPFDTAGEFDVDLEPATAGNRPLRQRGDACGARNAPFE